MEGFMKKLLPLFIIIWTVLLLTSCTRKTYPLHREVDYKTSYAGPDSIIYIANGEAAATCYSDTIIGNEKIGFLYENDSYGHNQAILCAYNIKTGVRRDIINVGCFYFCKVGYYDDKYALIMYNGYVILVDIFSGEILKKDTLFEHPERYTNYHDNPPYYLNGEPCFYEKGNFAYVQYENGSFLVDRMTVNEELTFICTIDGYYFFGTCRYSLPAYTYATAMVTYDMKTHEERTDNLEKLDTLRKLRSYRYTDSHNTFCNQKQQGKIAGCDCNPFFEKENYHENVCQQSDENKMVYLDETAEEIEKTINDYSNSANLYNTAFTKCFGKASSYYFNISEDTINNLSYYLFVDVEGAETNPVASWYYENKEKVAELFGFDDFDAFLEKIRVIKKEYQNIEDPANATNRLLLDGFILTKNGFALSPFVFYSSSLFGILALSPAGQCYLWLNNVDVVPSLLGKERIMLTRCVLYDKGQFIEYAGKKMTYVALSYAYDGTDDNPVYFTLFDGDKKITIDRRLMNTSPSYLATTEQEGIGFFGRAIDLSVISGRIILCFQTYEGGMMNRSMTSYFEYDPASDTVRFISRFYTTRTQMFIW